MAKTKKSQKGKNNPMYGKIPWNKGVRMSSETKIKISNNRKGLGIGNENAKGNKPNKTSFGKMENHPQWKGGITKGENKKIYYGFKGLERINRQRNATGSHTLEQWQDLKKKYNYMCLCCKQQEPFIKLTQDHVTPIIIGGSDNIENIQPLCGSCNSRKWAKIIDFRGELIKKL